MGFIGLGLIGGSIAKALRRFHPQVKIYAYTRTEATLDQALSEGVIDRKCTKEDPLFRTCRYIFLCAPVNDNIAYLTWLKDYIAPDCIITDVGSVKGAIHKAIYDSPSGQKFIGGGPSPVLNRPAIENATDFLLENAYYILTPGGEIGRYCVLRNLWSW